MAAAVQIRAVRDLACPVFIRNALSQSIRHATGAFGFEKTEIP